MSNRTTTASFVSLFGAAVLTVVMLACIDSLATGQSPAAQVAQVAAAASAS